jgi:hypothetical protein
MSPSLHNCSKTVAPMFGQGLEIRASVKILLIDSLKKSYGLISDVIVRPRAIEQSLTKTQTGNASERLSKEF